jgi:transcriptional regulator with XRE-family HTH domain
LKNHHLLKVFLVSEKITQRAAAKKVKMHYTRLNMYLNGVLNISEDEVEKICKGLNIDFKAYLNHKIKRL